MDWKTEYMNIHVEECNYLQNLSCLCLKGSKFIHQENSCTPFVASVHAVCVHLDQCYRYCLPIYCWRSNFASVTVTSPSSVNPLHHFRCHPFQCLDHCQTFPTGIVYGFLWIFLTYEEICRKFILVFFSFFFNFQIFFSKNGNSLEF